MDQIKIGNFISLCRKNKKLTQEGLAEQLNVSANAVSKWERGVNLPDYSNMQVLCEVLGISLNEFFAGEYIKENELEKQSERNILGILKFTNEKDIKYKILIIVISTLLVISFVILGKYIAGEGNIKGNVDVNKYEKLNIDYEVGANKYGEAVFKNPNKAFKRLKKDYSKGIKLIQKEYHLLPLTNFTYKMYSIYGWQVTTGTDEEKEQARFVSSFMDIYENSFNSYFFNN